ncbi:glycosyltransferase family 2 protein [Arcticibacter sp. MXS-1]|uniref:glycosyltransferase family 2 protein n=1 Tax=Arcticibacter sp. MXS-1 TaxID=3341726 RepID=UPI0035A8D0DC
MPRISVVLPVYNAEKYVGEAVDSILAQTYKDFELLVINDASTDRSLEVLEQYKDRRIRLINNEENLKVVKSLNKGIDLAQGEFIARMDADDISHPLRFERQLNYLERNPDIDICGSWVQTFGSEHHILKAAVEHEHIRARLFFLNPMFHPAIIFKRESFNKHKLRFDEQYKNAEDYGMWVNAIDLLTFGNVPEVLLKYRIHTTNVSVLKESNKAMLDDIHFGIFRFFLRKLRIDATERELWMHRKLGLVSVGRLDGSALCEYLHWLKKLVLANNEVEYFEKKHFRNVVISFIFYLVKQTAPRGKALLMALNTFSDIYGYKDCIRFFSDRAKVKLARAASF